jgi:hypothetical protein
MATDVFPLSFGELDEALNLGGGLLLFSKGDM